MSADQAHRGYIVSLDSNHNGFKSVNPFYMKYSPDAMGNFDGQRGYGYQSFEKFIDAANLINQGLKTPEYFDDQLPTGQSCLV